MTLISRGGPAPSLHHHITAGTAPKTMTPTQRPLRLNGRLEEPHSLLTGACTVRFIAQPCSRYSSWHGCFRTLACAHPRRQA